MLTRIINWAMKALLFMASILFLGAGFFTYGKIKRASVYPVIATFLFILLLGFRVFSDGNGLAIFIGLLLLLYLVYWYDWGRMYFTGLGKKESPCAVPSWCLIHTVLLVLLTYNSTYLTGYRIYHIPTQSMMPTLLPGDYVLVDLWWYVKNDVYKNDIVVFKHPYKNRDYIKRVKFIPEEIFLEKRVKPDTYIMLGDNEDHSEDSRVFGAVNENGFKGRACSIVFSLDRWGSFRSSRGFNPI